MSLLNQLKGENYDCEMDDLYMSVKLAKLCKTRKSKTMISGVWRQKGRGIATYVDQLEDNTKENKVKMRGILKVSILDNDALCKDFVACSLYDSKPFYFFQVVFQTLNGCKRTKNLGTLGSKR